jgi:hypothetical protein
MRAKQEGRIGEERGPLERSSMEAYAGIAIGLVLALLPLTWQIKAALFLVLCALCADFAWRSPLTFSWPKRLKTLVVLAIVIWLGKVGWENVQKQIHDEEFPSGAQYLTGWGSFDREGVQFARVPSGPPKIKGITASKVEVDGTRLRRYMDRYRVAAVCFHWDGMQDVSDTKGISKSAVFDIISGPIQIAIPWNDQFIREGENGATGTGYILLLLPKNLSPFKFETVREATDKGAVILQSTTGPP